MDNFVHLNLHTEYSLMNGVSSVDSYLKRAKELNMKAIAVTDYCNMFCAIEFYQKAKALDIKPILGLEIAIQKNNEEYDKKSFNLILLAKNYKGYRNLVKISSQAYRNIERNRIKVSKEVLKEFSSDLIVISPSVNGEITDAILKNSSEEAIKNIIEEYLSIYGKENFYLEVLASNLEKQIKLNDIIYEISKKYKIELVATNAVHYTNKGEHTLQDIVICIQNSTKLRDKNREKIRDIDLYLKSFEEIKENLGEKFNRAVENTEYIASLVDIEIKFGELQFPHYKVPNEYRDMNDYLKNLCLVNAKKIYGTNLLEKIISRLKHELEIIFKMGYSGYFIIVWDFIYYARTRGIPIGPGRGSAAGSLVSYVLGITKIDPLKYNLLFERFLNPERISMPDIDIDICRERRDELIDYVVNKYGREKVAHIITFGKMKARAAIRDVGRVLDINLKKIDRLAKLVPSKYPLEKTLKENVEVAKLYTSDIEYQKVIDISIKLDNKVRNTSTHAAGILITKDNLDEMIPIYLDEKDGVVLTQYQMKEVENLGLLKIDFLGLKNLTNIQKTLDNIKKDKSIDLDLDGVPLDDEKVYEILSKGDTLGVFQMEATGFRAILSRLKPTKFEDIVAMLSLYRPGPLQSGMVDNFINSKHGLCEIKYPHPSLEPILKETYGVILYQEQVMKIASYMANYSLGEADLLRRAMGKKKFEIMRENREKFVKRSIENGYDEKKAEEIFDLIDKFAGYGFNKSHSVSYAMLSYWTAYLKVNYPQAYYSAILTSDMGEKDGIATYFLDAKEHNIKIFPPNINAPTYSFEIKNKGISFSLAAIKNIGTLSKKIVEDFNENGAYTSYENFVHRNKKNGLNKKSLEALVLSGALDEIKGNRKEKFLSIDKVLDYSSKMTKFDEIQQMNLFGEAIRTIDSFNLPNSEDFSIDEKLEKEKEFLGFYLSSHPLDKFKDIIKIYSLKKLEDFSLEDGERINSFGMISKLKKNMTKRQELMAIFDIECYDKKLSCIAFPKTFEKFQAEIMEKKLIYFRAKVQIDKFRGDTRKKLVIEDIALLRDILKVSGNKLYVLIEPKDSSKYSRLKELIKENSGNTPLLFAIKDGNKKTVKNINRKVQLSSEFLKNLISLMGLEKIKIMLK